VIDAENGKTVVETLELADGFFSRLIGWQFRRRPTDGQGLLLVPCSSVHTCFVRFALDLVLLDRDGRVLAVRRGVRPWRAVWPVRGTHAVLEVPAGSACTEPGRRLRVQGPDGEAVPKSLRFLAAK
jgi:hypothetical protein